MSLLASRCLHDFGYIVFFLNEIKPYSIFSFSISVSCYIVFFLTRYYFKTNNIKKILKFAFALSCDSGLFIIFARVKMVVRKRQNGCL